MSDVVTIDIQLLQGVFGQIRQLQQTLMGLTGDVSAVDMGTATATNSMNKHFQGVNQVIGQVGQTADRSLSNVVQDLLGPIGRVTELENKLRDLNQRMSTTRSVREMSALKKEAAAVQEELNRISFRGVEQRVAEPASAMRGVLGGLVAPLASAFAVGGVIAFGRGMVQAAADAQAYGTSLEVMLKSKTSADAMVAQVKQFAATTPFELPEIQAASKQMLALGFESSTVVPQLKVLGNVASALNQPIGEIAYLFGTARSQGRLYTNDLMQFMNRGIPVVSELSKVMGVSEAQVRKLTEEGKVGFSELEKVMNNLGGSGGRFDGLMDRQSKTIGGMLSNLSDSWGQFKADIGVSLAPLISGGIGMLQDALGGLRSAMDWVKDHGPLVTGILEGVGIAVGLYTLALATNAVATFIATVRTAGFATAIGLQTVVTEGITAATALWEGAQWAINAALDANPIGVVIMAIAALVAAVIWLVNHWKQVTAYLEGMWASWKAGFHGLVDTVKLVFDSITEMAKGAWMAVKGVATGNMDMINAGISQVGKGFDMATKGVADRIVQTGLEQQRIQQDTQVKIAVLGIVDQVQEESKKKAAASGAVTSAISMPDGKNAVDASSFTGGNVPGKNDPKAKTTTGNGDGVTVGGSGRGGDGRVLNMNVTMNVQFPIGRDVQTDANSVADKVISILTNKFRDAEYALG